MLPASYHKHIETNPLLQSNALKFLFLVKVLF